MATVHPKQDENFVVVRNSLKAAGAAGDGQYEFIAAAEGAKLFLQYWLPKDKETERVIIALHGMSAHGWYFALMADEMAPNGIAFYAPDHRHHGLSDGLKGDLPKVMLIMDDIKAVVAHVRERHPKAKIFLLGESMGGILNINYMMDAPGDIAGMILQAPAVRPAYKFPIKEIIKGPVFLFSLLVKPRWRVVKTTGEEHLGMRNIDNIKYDREDPYHLKYVSARYLLSIKKLMDRASKGGAAGKINVPALVIQGGADTAVDAKSTRDFYEKLASKEKEFVFYPEAFHCMMSDPDCVDIFSRIREWVEAR
ncbi:MAG: lysophospholipase [bacterium]